MAKLVFFTWQSWKKLLIFWWHITRKNDCLSWIVFSQSSFEDSYFIFEMGCLGLANFLRLPAKAQNLSFFVFSFTANWFHHLYVFLELIFFILCGSIRVVVCRHWGKISVFFCFVFSFAGFSRRRSSIIVLFFLFFFLSVCLFVLSLFSLLFVVGAWLVSKRRKKNLRYKKTFWPLLFCLFVDKRNTFTLISYTKVFTFLGLFSALFFLQIDRNVLVVFM